MSAFYKTFIDCTGPKVERCRAGNYYFHSTSLSFDFIVVVVVTEPKASSCMLVPSDF